MLLKSGALTLTAVAETFEVWAVAAVLLGAGTAMVYSTRPAGVLADLQGIRAAI